MKCCFLFGHRDAPSSLMPILHRTVLRHIQDGNVTEFIVGHRGNFDRLAMRCLLAIKQQYPYIRICLLLAYHPSVRAVSVPSGIDTTWYPFEGERIPPRMAICQANRRAIDRAHCIIAYVRYPGNAAELMRYAAQKAHKSLCILPEAW